MKWRRLLPVYIELVCQLFITAFSVVCTSTCVFVFMGPLYTLSAVFDVDKQFV